MDEGRGNRPDPEVEESLAVHAQFEQPFRIAKIEPSGETINEMP